MTIKQTQRAGRLQEEGCSEYGEDDSGSTNGSYFKRPLACQEVSRHNQRGGLSVCKLLVQPKRICWRKNVGRESYKTESAKSISALICNHYKNNCFLDYILDVRQKESQI